MLETDDIQHILLARTPALTGRYEFLTFRSAAGGRAWLTAMLDKVQSAAAVQASVDERQTVGDRGVHLERPAGARRRRGLAVHVSGGVPAGHGGPRGGPGRHRCERSGQLGRRSREPRPPRHRHPVRPGRRGAREIPGGAREAPREMRRRRALSSLDLEATPPFEYAHDHFGYRDRLSQPIIEGTGETPTPGSGAPLKAGEFILGYPDEDGPAVNLPQPEVLSRNGSYMAYRRMEEHVGAFRDFLRQNGETPEEQELIAAKLMGRWRSGAPLVLAPDKDDPALGADLQRNNDFNYKQMDPHGYAVPLGSHIRRMNPRDTAHNMNRRRMIRRGATYGPHLPEGSDRGRRRARHRGFRDLREPGPAVRVRAERLGERSRAFTSSSTSATRSSATTTARSSTRSRSARSGRRSRVCPPSRPSGAGPTSSCPESRRSGISRRGTAAREPGGPLRRAARRRR